MAQLNIKDDETHQMAGDLARLTRTSTAAAVKIAIGEALEHRQKVRVEQRIQAVNDFLADLPPWTADMTSAEMQEQINRDWEIGNGIDPDR